MAVRFDVPEAELFAFHRRRRTKALLLVVAGVLILIAGIVGAQWFGPLAILCMLSCVAFIFGGVMATQSSRALRRRGDLVVVVDQRRVTVHYGDVPQHTDAPLASVTRLATRLDVLVHTETIETTSVPLDEAELDRRVAELADEGVVVTIPEKSPLRIAGLVVAVVAAVVALVLVLRVVPVLVLFGVVASLQRVAPDDPGTQLLLFFGLAFVCGGILLLDRMRRWRS